MAWCVIPTVVAVGTEDRNHVRERLADNASSVCEFVLRGFSVLVTHCSVKMRGVGYDRKITRGSAQWVCVWTLSARSGPPPLMNSETSVRKRRDCGTVGTSLPMGHSSNRGRRAEDPPSLMTTNFGLLNGRSLLLVLPWCLTRSPWLWMGYGHFLSENPSSLLYVRQGRSWPDIGGNASRAATAPLG